MGLRGGGEFYGQPGFPHFHVNRPKIVGTAQRKVSRKTAMGLKGGAGRELMLFPPLPLFCLSSPLSISRHSPLSEWEKWEKIWKILSNWSNLSSYAAPETYIIMHTFFVFSCTEKIWMKLLFGKTAFTNFKSRKQKFDWHQRLCFTVPEPGFLHSLVWGRVYRSEGFGLE